MFLQNEKFDIVLFVMLFFSGITNGVRLPFMSLSVKETHLVRCLTHISQRYFAPGRSVLISSPSTYRSEQLELIAGFQRISIWPAVFTVNSKINMPEKSDFIDRDGSYIILIPDGNIRSLSAEINGISVGQTKFTRLWKSEARFVVAGANKFSMLLQRDILDYFSKLRIYNCIIVSQEQDVVDKGYSKMINVNDVDTSMKLGVDSWFPY